MKNCNSMYLRTVIWDTRDEMDKSLSLFRYPGSDLLVLCA